jgi:N-acylneuraminate cytidylyltransferase
MSRRSKRIPNKNIRLFLGHPIIKYSIDAALFSNLFDEVMVSTDSDKIASIALKLGASVPFLRSDKNSDDHATTSDVIHEVLTEYRKNNILFDEAVCIYPTAPFLTSSKLIDAQNLLKKNSYDTVFPVIPYSFPVQRSLKIEQSKFKLNQPEFLNVKSQDLIPMYHDAGQFYFFQVKSFLENNQLLNENTGGLIISELEGQDIDNENDWKLAEMKFKLLNEKDL